MAADPKSHYEKLAANYDKHFGIVESKFPYRAKAAADVILKYGKPKKLLDIAGGTGHFTTHLSKVLGLEEIWIGDFSEGLLDEARKQGYKAVFTDLNDPDSLIKAPGIAGVDFDMVLVHDAFHHCKKEIEFLQAMDKILKPGALVVIGLDPDWPMPERLEEIAREIDVRQIRILSNWNSNSTLRLMEHKYFEAEPFVTKSQTYAEAARDGFLSFLQAANPGEVETFLKDEVLIKDDFTFKNKLNLFVYKKF